MTNECHVFRTGKGRGQGRAGKRECGRSLHPRTLRHSPTATSYACYTGAVATWRPRPRAVWSRHNAQAQHNERREEPKGQRRMFLCLKFSCLAILYEFYITIVMQLFNHAFFIPGTGFTQKMAFTGELEAQVKTPRARAVFY